MSSQKTSNENLLSELRETWSQLVIVPPSPDLAPPAWVLRIVDHVGGYLPTPTRKHNAFAPSMRKWPAYRVLQDNFGPSQGPRFWEMMMGVPVGWTDSEPLAMDNTHWSQRSPSKPSPSDNEQ